jgi:hypothetical protein
VHQLRIPRKRPRPDPGLTPAFHLAGHLALIAQWLFDVSITTLCLIWGSRISSPHQFVSMSSIAASASAAPTAPVKAPPQAGVLDGVNPVHFDAKNPLILFIVQVCCVGILIHPAVKTFGYGETLHKPSATSSTHTIRYQGTGPAAEELEDLTGITANTCCDTKRKVLTMLPNRPALSSSSAVHSTGPFPRSVNHG